jgi:ribosomal protein S18 acetylase RimI-like enzyme
LDAPGLPALLPAIEAAAARAWPALETAGIDGWIWRYASGGSLRANSVSTLRFLGADIGKAVRDAERRYRAKSAPCRFTVTDVSRPADLDERLAAMGYARGEEHVTMAKAIAGAAARGPADVVVSADPIPEWLVVYLAGLSPDRRAVAPAILAGLPARRAYFSCRRSGSVIGSGLSVAEGDLASVQCMATLAGARRQGSARSVLSAIEAWAAAQGCTHLYLQAESANAPAIGLYESFGFCTAGKYHVRTKG